MGDHLLEVDRLGLAIGGTQLLSDVSFTLAAGEVVGLVGESGSGKTLTGLTVLGLLPPDSTTTGTVTFAGTELLTADAEHLRRLRGNELSMIFQEPRASLHPARPVGKQIVDVVRAHENVSKAAARDRACDLLAQVGLPNPRRTLAAYTHELSGGMCQRVMIAMALVCEPRLLIADEPTTALDVTVQAQILELLDGLRAETGMGLLLITHDLGVVAETADRVAVMYAGRIVETGPTDAVLSAPRHPYTEGLLASVPRGQSGREERLRPIAGAPPSLARIPPG